MRDRLPLVCGHSLNPRERFALHRGEKWCPKCVRWVFPVGVGLADELDDQADAC